MDPAVRANAYAISYRLLGRRGPAGAVADAAAAEVERTGGTTEPDWLGFLAADAVARSLAVARDLGPELLDEPADPDGSARQALRRSLEDASGEQRAAAALVHLAGYAPADVATHLSLSVDRVLGLAGLIAPPPGGNYRNLGDPQVRIASRTAPDRAAPPSAAVSITSSTALSTKAAATEDGPGPGETRPDTIDVSARDTGPGPATASAGAPARSGRRGRSRGLLTTAAVAVVVLALVLASARSVGPRPRLGDRAGGVTGPEVGAAVVALPSAGCASPASGPDGTAAPSGGVAVRTVDTPEGARGYRLWTPPAEPTGPGVAPTPRPLVLAVPGFGQDAGRFAQASGLESTLGTDRVVATLDPLPPDLEVNVAQDTRRPDDILHALAVYDDVVSTQCIDLHRTSVLGYGPGGQLAGALACVRPRYFSAVVAVHGAFLPDPCTLRPPVSFLGVWTADDAVLPLGGGYGADLPAYAPAAASVTRVEAPAAEQVATAWAQLLGTDGPQTSTEQDGTLTREWTGGRDGSQVVSVTRPVGGHPWPTGVEDRIRTFLDRTARAT